MVTFSATVLLADSHLAAPEEGEFPLFVVLTLLAVIAVMAVAATHNRTAEPDEHTDNAGHCPSDRRPTPRPQPELLGHPLDRIDT
ncbi:MULTISPECIES: hypothetical protein [unclassified Rhodococcus (in: high G+C Gram-positive bacteria)]|uniref:hypothetical protein n=1 Tax=unclassified Rhodococcus (in: high G+C Gram-positive bacteria) TaxID=192944 RepID=UPI0016398EFA|nr:MULTISPECIES: hypothetical protein [unclassified Rhodococcus (in: high G+C Gram-positive bacteria)]MBC2640820.1 hypothetical protein [Rhodococcus sp. 3A]MBC2894436.1 hypothetical protein [Rhodococcus sp. 4CII]